MNNLLGVCPVLCSQKGEYINGECQCNPGWKGKECQLRHDECEVPDCNGHGHCVTGKCSCVRGYKGKFCEEGKWIDKIIKKKTTAEHFISLKFLYVSMPFFYVITNKFSYESKKWAKKNVTQKKKHN